MENDELKRCFCEDIASLCKVILFIFNNFYANIAYVTFHMIMLIFYHSMKVGIFPIVVHGGGPQIAKMLANLHIESNFVQVFNIKYNHLIEYNTIYIYIYLYIYIYIYI